MTSDEITTEDGITVVAVRRTYCPAGAGGPLARVFSSAAEAEARLAVLGVAADTRAAIVKPTINWDRGERLLLVHGGMLANPGYRLVVDAISHPAGGLLRVRGRVTPPPPGSIQMQVLVSPCLVIHLADPAASAVSDVELVLKPGS